MTHPDAPRPGTAPGGDATVDELVVVAAAVAEAARHEAMSAFRTPLFVEDKHDDGGFDPVTIADRTAEAAMRTVLRERRPDDAVVGEELEDTPGTSGLTWVLDPIDGTRAYICGLPTWGTLVAVTDGTRPFLGVIDQGHTGERFVGISHGDRREAWLEHRDTTTPLAVRDGMDLAHATLFTTFPEVGTPDERAAFERVRDRVRLTRYGTDCYAYAMLAAGHVDLVIEAGLSPHDVAALVPIVEGAGGVATSWTGGPGHDGGRFLAAATPDLHRAARQALAA
ncbi:inositol monophosphatase family protein [Salsipaludibacter albus]|uniref:inositol monophosphatase family protein n=1 Tax=Salsipaludibacter albus TaxID=2849650 RepID=UPI001EE3A30D|nr:inositol monophosphatase family protein [Salsipaludibacter albus]MBY5161716.1 inositol monophosphatase family protein [Salsipaludibacter albus]